MQYINKFNKGFQFLLCIIDICKGFSFKRQKKKGITVVKAFQEILDESGRKPNKIN